MGNYEAFDTFLNCVGLTYRLRRVLVFAYVGLGLLVAGALVYSALAGQVQALPIHQSVVSTTNTANIIKENPSTANTTAPQPSCFLLPNLTKLDTFGLDSDGIMLVNGTVNFVTPDYTGVTVNGNSFQVYENSTYTISTSPKLTLELLSTSYIPIAHSVDMQLCSASQLQDAVLVLPPQEGGSAAAFSVGGGSGVGGGGGGGQTAGKQPGQSYTVAFIATNMPKNTEWELGINGSEIISASNTIGINLTAGEYGWNAIITNSTKYTGREVYGIVYVDSPMSQNVMLNYSLTPYAPTLTISNNPTTANVPDEISAEANPTSDHVEILISNSVVAKGRGSVEYTYDPTTPGTYNVIALDTDSKLETSELLVVEPTPPLHENPVLDIASNIIYVNTTDPINAIANPTSDKIEILVDNAVVATGKGEISYTFNTPTAGTYNVVAYDLTSNLQTDKSITVLANNTTRHNRAPTLTIQSNPTTANVPDEISAEANPTSDHVEILISNSVVASGKGNATYSFDPQYPGTYNVVALDTNSQLETSVALVVRPTVPKHGGSFECGATVNRTITLSPAQVNSYNEIVASMIELGKEGGGIIRLDSGTYYLYNEINLNYSNVAIIGNGMGKTIISMPPDPIQNFTIEPQGVPVGTYNPITGKQEGPAGHLFETRQWVVGIGLCNLTLDGNIHSLNEDWAGSLILDTFGGKNHTYENIAMVNLDGLQPGPNGVNIGCPGTPCVRAASGYLINNLISMNYDIVDTGKILSGPGFLVVRMLSNTTITGVKGVGVVEFDGPAIDSNMSNWSVDGHLLLEPFPVPWGNSTFDNVTFNVTQFPSNAPHAATALEIAQMVIPGSHGVRGATNFTGLRIINSKFVGGDVQGLGNAYYVENTVFDTAIDSIPKYFINNTVVYPTSGRTWFPIAIGGAKHTATSVTMENDKFEFVNGTVDSDPFILQANTIIWKNSEVVIKGQTTGYLFQAPNVIATVNSTISGLSYIPLGDGAPDVISLLDAGNSIGFVGTHIRIDGLVNIKNNIDGGGPADGEASQSKSASAPITIILQNSSIVYGTSDIITATAANSKDIVILEINKESIAQGKGKAKYNAAQLPAGVQVIYAYDVSTGADAMVTVNISKATPQLNLTVPPSYTYNGVGGEIRYSISTINNQLTAVLIVNNKTVGNTKSASKYMTKKSIGDYVAMVETPGNANYTAENTLVSNFTIINPRSV